MSTKRSCYAYDCTNADYKLHRWSNKKCAIHGCFQGTETCDCEPPFRLWTFPTEKKDSLKRQRWIRILNRALPQNTAKFLPVKDHHRVCSIHFVDGKPTPANPDPTLYLGYVRKPQRDAAETSRAKRKEQRERAAAVQAAAVEMPQEAAILPMEVDQPREHKEGAAPKTVLASACLVLATIISILLSLWRKARAQITQLKEENTELRKQVWQLRVQLASLRAQARCRMSTDLLKTDSDVLFYTGIPTMSQFNTLHTLVSKFVRRRWTGLKNSVLKGRKFISSPKRFGPKPNLHSKDELLLTLMRLRLGLLNKDLAKRFFISISLCSQIFHCWLTALYKTFAQSVTFLSMDKINPALPDRFRCLPNLRSIIDCSEIFIETAKNMDLHNATWSNYKGHNTGKFLISVAPTSMITYISKVYGGRLSDKKIVNLTGFLDKMNPHEMVMADKGFNIGEECAIRSINLYVPPGKRGLSQMSNVATYKTKRIANLRILVEQVIRRLKTFRILRFVPITLVPSLTKLLKVCAALSNLSPPIYRN